VKREPRVDEIASQSTIVYRLTSLCFNSLRFNSQFELVRSSKVV
jgi:hypothetical protein